MYGCHGDEGYKHRLRENDPGYEETALLLTVKKPSVLQRLASPPTINEKTNEKKNPSPPGPSPGDGVEPVFFFPVENCCEKSWTVSRERPPWEVGASSKWHFLSISCLHKVKPEMALLDHQGRHPPTQSLCQAQLLHQTWVRTTLVQLAWPDGPAGWPCHAGRRQSDQQHCKPLPSPTRLTYMPWEGASDSSPRWRNSAGTDAQHAKWMGGLIVRGRKVLTTSRNTWVERNL